MRGAGRGTDDADRARGDVVEQVGDARAERHLAGVTAQHAEGGEVALAERLGPVAEGLREARDRDRGIADEVEAVERDQRAAGRCGEAEPVRELAELGVDRDHRGLGVEATGELEAVGGDRLAPRLVARAGRGVVAVGGGGDVALGLGGREHRLGVAFRDDPLRARAHHA